MPVCSEVAASLQAVSATPLERRALPVASSNALARHRSNAAAPLFTTELPAPQELKRLRKLKQIQVGGPLQSRASSGRGSFSRGGGALLAGGGRAAEREKEASERLPPRRLRARAGALVCVCGHN